MKSSRLALILFIIAWAILKVIFLRSQDVETGIYVGVFLNILALIVLPFLAIRESYNPPRTDGGFLKDAKIALQPGVLYAVLMAVGIFIYFSYVDPEYQAGRYQEAMALLEAQVGDEANYRSLQEQEPALANLSREDYLESQKSNMELIFSEQLFAGGALIALMIAAILYGLMVTLIYRKLLLKSRAQ